jgi:signal transduction histidine kinase
VTGDQPARVPLKWRPTLGLIIFTVLAIVTMLPLAGLFFFRIYENQLIRQTETELIGQSVALAVSFAREADESLPKGFALGAAPPAPPVTRRGDTGVFQPILPTLDLAGDDLKPRRPVALPARVAPAPDMLSLGARLYPDTQAIQQATLAGFRLLDHNGIVIAGREEVGLSLAHVEEVAEAMAGRFRTVMRVRVSDSPPPPLYSVSRGTGMRLFAAMPVVVRGQVAGVVYASRTPSNIFQHLYEERGKLILAGFTVAAMTALLGFIFVRTINRPMQALITRTAEIGAGNREAMRPLDHHGTREIAQLSQAFLDMSKTLHNRSEYIATFAAHVSHELKSPLTSIQGAAELLRDDIGAGSMPEDAKKRFLDNIIADTGRLTAMVQRLRDLARAEQPIGGEPADLPAAAAALRSAFPDLAVMLEAAGPVRLPLSQESLTIILTNLADNAARHGAKTLHIAASGDTGLVISNDGAPISAANRARIFDAFFTTRREEGGTGMGLAIIRSLVSAHGGDIELLESDGPVAFRIRFPA